MKQLKAYLTAALSCLSLSALAAPPCPPYQELRPPRITRDGTVLWLRRGVDPAWFNCKRKERGSVRVESQIERDGAWDHDSSQDSVGASFKVGAWASNYCGRSGQTDPKRVRFVVTGKGPLAEASFTTEPVAALCGCSQYRPANIEAKASARGVSYKVAIDAPWLACNREGGGQLELRVYTGATEAEAQAKNLPAAVVRGLEKTAKSAGTLPRGALCSAGARFAILELAGRGTLGLATGAGQETVKLDCR